MKKPLILVLCLALILGLVIGCAGTQTEENPNEPGQTPGQTDEANKSGNAGGDNQNAAGTAEDLKDGTYEAESAHTEHGWYTAKVTIEGGKYTDIEFIKYDGEGKEVDLTEYKHPPAVEAMEQYPKQLLETQDASKVDVISGATSTHKDFLEIMAKIREQAAQ